MGSRFPLRMVIMFKHVKQVIIANGIVNGIYSDPYILFVCYEEGGHILICLMIKF